MTQIQENIKNTALELIQQKLMDTMLNLAYDMGDLHLSEPEEELPQMVTDTIEKLRSYVLELPQILELDLNQRSDYIMALTALRSHYAENAVPFYSYVSASNHIANYALWLYKCTTIDDKVDMGNYGAIEHSVKDFVHEYICEAEPEEKQLNMAAIVALMPLRMTRQRYLDLVKKSFRHAITGNTKAQLRETMRVAKSLLYPTSSPDYTDFVPAFKEEIDGIFAENLEKMSSEELEDILLQIDNLQANLESYGDYLNMVFNDINYLIILASYAIDEEYLFNENMLVKDSLYSAVDMLKTKDFDLYAEALTEKSAELIEDNFGTMRELDKTLMEYTTKYYGTDVINEELETLLGTYVNINLLYMSELAHSMQTPKTEAEFAVVTDEETEAALDELADFISNAPASIYKARDKFAKGQFLGQLPIEMTDSEFDEYLNYALDGVKMKNIGIVTLTDIYNLLVEDGVIPDENDEEEDCDCGHHHHHHDHCDCGHDHHHHDHCDCGHDHDHPHLHVVKGNK